MSSFAVPAEAAGQPLWLSLFASVLTHPRHEHVSGEHRRNSWRERACEHPELQSFALEFEQTSEGRALLDLIFGYSPYLGWCLTCELEFFRRLCERGFDASFHAELERLVASVQGQHSTAQVMKDLRVSKRRLSLLIALADLTKNWSIDQVMSGLSEFADTAVRLATDHLLQRAYSQGRLKSVFNLSEQRGKNGFVVIAVGKLGASELNYSSDIDLVALYDETTFKISQRAQLPRTLIQLTQELVRVMQEPTAEGYVFRVDMRLRPDAAPIVVSVKAAEVYYASLGQNWERAAFIRARPIAGDLPLGQAFLKLVRPFLWRYRFDFSAVQDIHAIRRRVQSRHGHKLTAVNGHDIKLGRGGIRELEFFVQTQQLIFGGRNLQLRSAQVCSTLMALAESGHISQQVADELVCSYRFLRLLEHRLQMVDDRQTHTLPGSEQEVEILARFCGYHQVEQFREDLLGHLARVERHYLQLFGEDRGSAQDANQFDQILRSLDFPAPDQALQLIATWKQGRHRATRGARAYQLLAGMTESVVRACAKQRYPSRSLEGFDRFLASLSSGVQLLSLVSNNPHLLDFILDLVGMSHPVAGYLGRKPELLDALLEPEFFSPLPDREHLHDSLETSLTQADDCEALATAACRWANERRFQLVAQVLRSRCQLGRARAQLNSMALVVMQELLARAKQEISGRRGSSPAAEVAVLGLGDLGAAQLSLHSQLDFMLVYQQQIQIPDQAIANQSPDLAEYHAALTRWLVTVLSAATKQGVLYPLDVTPRASGYAGPLSLQLEALQHHHQREDHVQAWEHILLSRACPVASSSHQFSVQIRETVNKILARQRTARELGDLLQTCLELRATSSELSPWLRAKECLSDIDTIVRYLVLRNAHARPQLIEPGIPDALVQLARFGYLTEADYSQLLLAYRLACAGELILELLDPAASGERLDLEPARPLLSEVVTAVLYPEQPVSANPMTHHDLESEVMRVYRSVDELFTKLVI